MPVTVEIGQFAVIVVSAARMDFVPFAAAAGRVEEFAPRRAGTFGDAGIHQPPAVAAAFVVEADH